MLLCTRCGVWIPEGSTYYFAKSDGSSGAVPERVSNDFIQWTAELPAAVVGRRGRAADTGTTVALHDIDPERLARGLRAAEAENGNDPEMDDEELEEEEEEEERPTLRRGLGWREPATPRLRPVASTVKLRDQSWCTNCCLSLFPRCGARGRALVFGTYGNPPKLPNYGAKPPRTRTVGFEFEGNWPFSALWDFTKRDCEIKNDGSLRGHNAAEITMAPVLSTEYMELLESLPLEHLDPYSRAGMHEWFGVEDYSWSFLNKLLAYAVWHEREFTALVPDTRKPIAERDAGGFPMKIGWEPRLYSTKNGLMRSLYGEALSDTDLRHVGGSKRANDGDGPFYKGPINRTWWLNVHAYFRQKCVEVRLLHATPVVGVIEAWTELWLRLLNKIPLMSWDELKTTPLSALAPRVSDLLWKCAETYRVEAAKAGVPPNFRPLGSAQEVWASIFREPGFIINEDK